MCRIHALIFTMSALHGQEVYPSVAWRVFRCEDKIILFYMDGITKPMGCFQDGPSMICPHRVGSLWMSLLYWKSLWAPTDTRSIPTYVFVFSFLLNGKHRHKL